MNLQFPANEIVMDLSITRFVSFPMVLATLLTPWQAESSDQRANSVLNSDVNTQNNIPHD